MDPSLESSTINTSTDPSPQPGQTISTQPQRQPQVGLVLTSTTSNTPKTVVAPAEDPSPSPTTKSKDKHKKRNLFSFGRKKTDDSKTISTTPATMTKPASPDPASLVKSIPGMSSTRPSTTSPAQLDQAFRTPNSPNRALSVSSPRLLSPAGSQIFERDVQEDLVPNSPAIPSHMQTENYIPPVLDASSEAITDGHLSTDSVEIITHPSHQPASATLTGVPSYDNLSAAWAGEDFSSLADKDLDSASNYGSLDATDVRRLSFISFADVVQAEQAANPHAPGSPHAASPSRDSMHLAGLTSLSSMNMNRSSSPLRSPVSSQGLGTSPPTSKSGSIKGLELSPSRKPLGSPTSMRPTLLPHIGAIGAGGEVAIETMTQALRRTGSADLSSFKSVPTSPIEGPSR